MPANLSWTQGQHPGPLCLSVPIIESGYRDDTLEHHHGDGHGPGSVLGAYPISPLHVGMVALPSIVPGSYVARHTLELPADISASRFLKAWESITADNDVLRTIGNVTEAYGTVNVVDRSSLKQHGRDLEAYLQADEQRPMK